MGGYKNRTFFLLLLFMISEGTTVGEDKNLFPDSSETIDAEMGFMIKDYTITVICTIRTDRIIRFDC